ncbi:kinase-like domain-containing protein [Rhizophagus irregularis DAOM 181602=DAOM 197198]|nr:kinase-like domain-containing protein [Rhizophagus irregularis DAOM 181602=DAOM 197198]
MEENLEDQEIKFTPEKSKFCPECNGPTTSFVEGLEKIHSEGKVRKNVHRGNLLVDEKDVTDTRSDVGICGPRYYHETNQIYGVLPCIAPEVLRGENGENYTAASDIHLALS